MGKFRTTDEGRRAAEGRGQRGKSGQTAWFLLTVISVRYREGGTMSGRHKLPRVVLLLAGLLGGCGPEADPKQAFLSHGAVNVCSVNWTGLAGNGLWQTPGNWNPLGVPGPSDSVCIGPAFNVTLSATVPAINSLTCDGTLSVSDTLSIASESMINMFTLTGTLTGSGNLTVSSLMNWTGTISGSGQLAIPFGATLNIPGANLSGRTVNNDGTVVMTGTFYITGGAVFNNRALFDIQSDNPIRGDGTFNNTGTGTFRKSMGSGTGGVESGPTFNNAGAVQVQTGTLSF